LLARPFDARRLKLTGEPFSLSDKVGGHLNYTDYFNFSVSGNGVLAFDPGLNRQRRQYRWVDRRGQLLNSLDVTAGVSQHWLSPDEKRFVAARPDPQTPTFDLWLYDISGRNAQRFTFDPANEFNPIWAPDGSRIVWTSTRDGIANLYQKAANSDGEETLLLKSDYSKVPTDWSRDGRFIIYTQSDPKTKGDVWVLTMGGVARRSHIPWSTRKRMKRRGRSRQTGDGWPMPLMRRAGMRSTWRDSPVAAASGRSRPAGATIPSGGGMGGSCSTTRAMES
jgi:hypothetical protein